MFAGLLGRFREGKATRHIQSALGGGAGLDQALAAARQLCESGGQRCVPLLCETLSRGPESLRVESALALAAVHRRCHDSRILEAMSAAILSDRQPDVVREAVIGSLSAIVDSKQVGSLLEVLKSTRSPLPLRNAAIHALKRLSYPELLERLVENYLLGRERPARTAICDWATKALIELNDQEKLAKIHEIIHGRRKLRYRPVRLDSQDPAMLIELMAAVDPLHSMRYLSHMVDESTRIISSAAVRVLRDVRSKHAVEAETKVGGGGARITV